MFSPSVTKKEKLWHRSVVVRYLFDWSFLQSFASFLFWYWGIGCCLQETTEGKKKVLIVGFFFGALGGFTKAICCICKKERYDGEPLEPTFSQEGCKVEYPWREECRPHTLLMECGTGFHHCWWLFQASSYILHKDN